jgi:hypothetical protein
MSAFGTAEPVEIGRVYGSVEEGTARVFHQPPVIHPADHFSRRAIGHAIDWFQRTLQGARALPPDDQIWYWKEVGNLLALLGMVLLLILPAATLFPFKALGSIVPLSALFPQSITNQVMIWALLVGLISSALFVVWHLTSGRKGGGTSDHYGLTWAGRVAWSKVGKSFLLASLIALSAYLTLVISSALFTIDYRFWVFAVKPMSLLQARIALSYLIPFVLFFAVYGVVLFGQLRRDLNPLGDAALVGALSTLGLVTAYFQRVTGHIYAGAFLSGILVTWIVVASQAIHFGF